MDSTAGNYNPLKDYNIHDPLACLPKVTGCGSNTFFNYNPLVNDHDPATCIAKVYGQTSSLCDNFKPTANLPCVKDCAQRDCTIAGCSDCCSLADRRYEDVAQLPGTTTCVVDGCMDSAATNYNPSANTEATDASLLCVFPRLGCTSSTADNYVADAEKDVEDPADPKFCSVTGCTNPTAINYNPTATVNAAPGSEEACTAVKQGCLDSTFDNYDRAILDGANVHNGSQCHLAMCATAGFLVHKQWQFSMELYNENIGFIYQSVAQRGEEGEISGWKWSYVQSVGANGQAARNRGWYEKQIEYAHPAYNDYERFLEAYQPHITSANGFTAAQMENKLATAIKLVTPDRAACLPELNVGCTTSCLQETVPDSMVAAFNGWKKPLGASNTGKPCISNWLPAYNFDPYLPISTICTFYGCQDNTMANYVSQANIPMPCHAYVDFCKDPTATNYWNCNHLRFRYVQDGANSGFAVSSVGSKRETKYDEIEATYGYMPAKHKQSKCAIPGCMNPTSTYYNSNARWNPFSGSPDRDPCLVGTKSISYPRHGGGQFVLPPDNAKTWSYGQFCGQLDAYIGRRRLSESVDGDILLPFNSTPPDVLAVASALYERQLSEASAQDYGCMDVNSLNYDSYAVQEGPNMCVATQSGCTDSIADNYEETANNDDGTCVYSVEGCMHADALNYDSLATVQQTTECVPRVQGCTQSGAYNYKSAANDDDNTCWYAIYGCMSPGNMNYDSTANVQTVCIPERRGCTDTSSGDYDAYYNVDDGSCTYPIVGCMLVSSFNYDSTATASSGSCDAMIFGCTDSTFSDYSLGANVAQACTGYQTVLGCTQKSTLNFDSRANTDDGTCREAIPGCTDSAFGNYEATKTIDDGTCKTTVRGCMQSNNICYNSLANEDFGCGAANCEAIGGCTNSLARGYSPTANTEDGTCIYDIYGCMSEASANYDTTATVQPLGACRVLLRGCTYSGAANYFSQAEYDDGSCAIQGCTDSTGYNFNPSANSNDGTCVLPSPGCTHSISYDYRSYFDVDDGSCSYAGCTDTTAINFDPTATVSDALLPYGGCIAAAPGCTDSRATNYASTKNVDDGSCYTLRGCTVPYAPNYVSYAQEDDGSCDVSKVGCTDSRADNYVSAATADKGDCILYGCTDSLAINYLSYATVLSGVAACTEAKPGCTHSIARNFNVDYNVDNGACEYEGCMDSNAFGFDPIANILIVEGLPGGCITKVSGCQNVSALNYDSYANDEDVGQSACYFNYPPPSPPALPPQPPPSKPPPSPPLPVVTTDFVEVAVYYVTNPDLIPPPSPPPSTRRVLEELSSEISGRALSESTAGDWRTQHKQALADAVGVPLSYVNITFEGQTTNGYKVVYAVTAPPGQTAEYVTAILSGNGAAAGSLDSYFSSLFGVTVTGSTLAVVSASPPPPFTPPSPPSPPPPSDDLKTWHVVFIVMCVLFFSFYLLGLGAFKALERRKRRTDQVTVIPEVGERAVVQPPSLPAETPSNSVPPPPPPAADRPAPPAAATTADPAQFNDRVPVAAPVETALSASETAPPAPAESPALAESPAPVAPPAPAEPPAELPADEPAAEPTNE